MSKHPKKIAVDYADFAEYDRRQLAIVQHLLTAFIAGLVVGILGWLVHVVNLGPLQDIFDPYAYFALAIVVGFTASEFAWAVLAGVLAALAPLVAVMGGIAVTGQWDFDSVGGSALGLNLVLAGLFALSLLAYAARRRDVWGDVAVGLTGGLVLADIVDRATPGLASSAGRDFWPWPAALVGLITVAMVFVMRRRTAGRARAFAVAATMAGATAAITL
ncbi:hypothetical protein SAMN05421505_10254 [Sinosporangium album]|uniref:Uncharacterized protein n=1 Tax=Sinosporangium album TaxID=504805 RepID=A0A1G7RUY2_9ACTN|nr:hypothetical protein [Sinosporangium album]SDG14556.1 hypothetical protein SAMN05421505_10254 [Sinosporangium album]